VLKPGGRLAGYLIHTPAGLSPSETERAAELGPSEVAADRAPEVLTRLAAFTLVHYEDVTSQFRTACQALLTARVRLEPALRMDEGDEIFEAEHARKTAMLTGIHEGLLLRSLVVAVAPEL
jgi:hypothetical protein